MARAALRNEAERRAGLRHLAASEPLLEPEPEFDELVELAACVCETPMGLLTLVDGARQWFKAAMGVGLREVPLELAIRQNEESERELLIVEDATKDARTARSPLVTGEAGVRFYAGVALRRARGQELGTLCVMDRLARTLTANQIATLTTLGRHASARLERGEQQRMTEGARRRAEEMREAELRRYQEELEAANAQLRELATTDPLTGLANRRMFDERLAGEFLQARRHGRALSVMMLDVDNFKQRNDLYGHDEGDATLRRLAVLMAQTVRRSDLLVRYGGEEFILLLPETDEVQGLQLGERILAAVRTEPWLHGLPVTMSGGVASLTESTPSQQRLVTLADEALYAAKRAGKDSMVGYSDCAQKVS